MDSSKYKGIIVGRHCNIITDKSLRRGIFPLLAILNFTIVDKKKTYFHFTIVIILDSECNEDTVLLICIIIFLEKFFRF